MRIFRSIIFLFPTLVLAGCSLQTSQSQNVASTNTTFSVNENSVAVVSDAKKEITSFYVAEKQGKSTVLYEENISTKQRTEVFHFEEARAYVFENGNTYDALPPAVAYSEVLKKFAYIDTNGLRWYDPTSKQSEDVIVVTGKNGQEIDGVKLPAWSKTLSSATFWIYSPKFSADGKYLSFVEGYYEGLGVQVLNISTGNLEMFAESEQPYTIGRHRVDWSVTGASLVVGADDGGYTNMGLFVALNGDFKHAKNIALTGQIIGNAVFLDHDTILYDYTPTSGNTFRRLAIIDVDGKNAKDITQKGANYVVKVGDEGDKGFYKIDPLGDSGGELGVYDASEGAMKTMLRGVQYPYITPQGYVAAQNLAVVNIVQQGEQRLVFRSVDTDAGDATNWYESSHQLGIAYGIQEYLGVK